MELLKNIKKTYHHELDAIFGADEVDSFFYLLIAHYFDISRLQLAIDLERSMTAEGARLMQNALEQLKQEAPIQYIIGETEFFGLPFIVNENVLIPRPETEELVGLVLQSINHQISNSNSQELHILDIGTGSGCIAVSLAKNLPNAKVYALDVSKDALKIAKQNAMRNNVDIEFMAADILDASCCAGLVSDSQKFDIIVSNPPYVRYQEQSQIKNNVLQNEPHLALFVDDTDALQFYRAICEFSVDKLKHPGMLFFEINAYLGQEMKTLMAQYHFKTVELKQDLFGKDRMIKAIQS